MNTFLKASFFAILLTLSIGCSHAASVSFGFYTGGYGYYPYSYSYGYYPAYYGYYPGYYYGGYPSGVYFSVGHRGHRHHRHCYY